MRYQLLLSDTIFRVHEGGIPQLMEAKMKTKETPIADAMRCTYMQMSDGVTCNGILKNVRTGNLL